MKNIPTFSEVQAQLSWHRLHRCIPVPDPLNIPDALRTTLRGCEVADGDPHKNKPFLMYSGQGGRLLIFCAHTELELVHKSEYIVCDGTFEMCPDSATIASIVGRQCHLRGLCCLTKRMLHMNKCSVWSTMSDSFVRQHWQQTYVYGRFRNGRDQGYQPRFHPRSRRG